MSFPPVLDPALVGTYPATAKSGGGYVWDDVMWGDAGTIYYWVDERAARRGDFTNSWLILQC